MPDDEVRALFADGALTLLGERDALAASANLKARGATRLVERTYRAVLRARG